MSETQIREAIVDLGRHLHTRQLLAAADGNISYRLSDSRILITPKGMNKARIRPSDLAVINLDNQIQHGEPSSERLMHLEIYRRAPLARAIVHAHPPTAIAWSLARPHWSELPTDALPEVILAAGRIPIAPYARPGTQAMGDVLAPFLPECRLMILARHGALCWGEDLDEAGNGIERLEQLAIILTQTELLGGAQPLDSSEIEALKRLRTQIGPRII